jgi:hypothetical protein
MMDEVAVTSASEYDLANIHEEEFELHTTYIVPDLPVDPGTPNRAEATLPRNLVLKTSQALSDVSPRATVRPVLTRPVSGPRRLEYRIHPTRDALWASRGRNLCQRCCTEFGQQEILLEGKYHSPVQLALSWWWFFLIFLCFGSGADEGGLL